MGRRVIGVTMGDPGGVGPEVLLRALELCERHNWPVLRVFGDRQQLDAVAARFSLMPLSAHKDVELIDCPVKGGGEFPLGRWTWPAAKAQVSYIRHALKALDRGEIQSLVTGPIHKQALVACDLPYHGHTEWLAAHAGVEVAMMLAGPRLRVVPVTIHIPLSEVPNALHPEDIFTATTLTAQALRDWFGISTPKLAVCALNPHAGDGGLMGHEDEEIVRPAVLRAQKYGLDVVGPLPADTAFFFAYKQQYDAVIAMYHDQALGPLKLVHFDDAINVTLGLPFLRVSVDHGTAYDIAPRGQANATSMVRALSFAAGRT